MDLNLIQIFTLVAENQSFTKAAEKLNMDKSTTSSKVTQLETNLGVRLLNRTTRSVTLTEAGEGFLQYCNQIMDTAKEAQQYTMTLRDEATGTLRVSAPNTLSRLFISELLQPFMDDNPHVVVDFVLGYTSIDMVRDQIDVALRIDVGSAGLKDSSLIARRLTRMKLGLFASPSYLDQKGKIESTEQLINSDIIEFSRGQSFEFMRELLEDPTAQAKLQSRIKINDIYCVKEAAISGLGIAILPLLTAKYEVSAGALIPVLPDIKLPTIDLYVVYPNKRWMPAKLKIFLEHLSELDIDSQ